MKTGATTRILMAAALLAATALAATKDSFAKPATDDAIAKQVRHVVLSYPYYYIGTRSACSCMTARWN
jgi:hypothetical protein